MQLSPRLQPNTQLTAQRTAAALTQQQIRAAVRNPSFEATRAATATGQVTSQLATFSPCTLAPVGPECWNYFASVGPWNWGRKLRAQVDKYLM
jgi:hypothetical protein